MISRIFATVLLIAGLHAQAQVADTFECNYKPQGVDYFPWSVANPFPWSDIQGVWKLSSDSSMYLKARVISSTKNRKILNVSLVSVDRCAKPIASGTGYIDSLEKNVVRAVLSDGIYRYQIKLGMFDARDLKIDANVCGPNILAATVKILGTTPKAENIYRSTREAQTQNMVLKKVSDDLNAVCKKPIDTTK
ncbi:MAG: hypothetical protein H7328_06865 [Bdellovibrio sp.]|nr:hypothetical protein [Bdellovibrio sp.]